MIDLPTSHLLDHAENLRDKVVLITGGAAGFGEGTARLAAKHGAKVVIADLKLALTQKAVDKIRQAGGICTAPDAAVDVTKPESLQIAFDHALKEFGRVPDVVIANAGVNLNDHFEEDGGKVVHSGQSTFPRPPRNITIGVNLTGVINTAKIAQALWKEHPMPKGEGRKRRLVILSSMAGMTGIPGASTYATSKHALLAYWKGIVEDLEKDGENAGYECYALCPFFAKTKIFDSSILFILAGIPLVPVPVMVDTMLYAASKPVDPAAQPGGVIILPDDGDPAMATSSEYNPLISDWSNKMHERCAKTDQQTGWLKVAPIKRIWRDIARNLFGVSPIGLLLRSVLAMLVIAVGVGASIKGLRLMPTWLTVALGVALGSLGSKKRSKGSRRARG